MLKRICLKGKMSMFANNRLDRLCTKRNLPTLLNDLAVAYPIWHGFDIAIPKYTTSFRDLPRYFLIEKDMPTLALLL